MDPLAHGLFGAAFARTRAGRETSMALPVAILAANVPDLDVFAYVRGGDFALWFRRGWTHGPLGLLLLPPLVVGLVLLVRRWTGDGEARGLNVKRLGLIAYLMAVSHPLLDWLNTYGVRLLMPFEPRWFYGDALFIVDPWMWLLLGGSVFLCHESRRASVPSWALLAVATSALLFLATNSTAGKALWVAGLVAIGFGRARFGGRPASTRLAEALLAAFVVYTAAMVAGGRAAATIVRSELAQAGVGPIEGLMVGPQPMSPMRREVVVETSDSIRVGNFDWRRRPRVELGPWTAVPARGSSLGRRGLADPCVRGFANWARFPSIEVDEAAAAQGLERVHLIDIRYARRPGPSFGAVTVENPPAPP
ncbi:MAG: metal-dependent hydrolase [Acidobacteriota bacterium]|nr:metal-dependent hydrolase [Acidobacteriota bacterium]